MKMIEWIQQNSSATYFNMSGTSACNIHTDYVGKNEINGSALMIDTMPRKQDFFAQYPLVENLKHTCAVYCSGPDCDTELAAYTTEHNDVLNQYCEEVHYLKPGARGIVEMYSALAELQGKPIHRGVKNISKCKKIVS